jgi:hypothetical protein
MRLRTKVFEGPPGDLLVKFQTDSEFKLRVLEDLMQKHGVATTDPQYALQTLGKIASRQMDSHFVVLRSVRGTLLEDGINIEAHFVGFRIPVVLHNLIMRFRFTNR